MFKRILIANRGEIAVRIIRSCRELGIEVVGIYSTEDKHSMHVKLSDIAVCIGPPQATESYLNMNKIISVAKFYKVDAIHPGYGFLAESSEFAKLCLEFGIKFIGPSSEVISLMGNKALAKRKINSLGIPIIPGSDGIVTDVNEGKNISNHIGYPILIKAANGGGGRGIRVVYTEEDFEKMFEVCREESYKAFNCGELYIEKYILAPRHIEVQVLADEHGNVAVLGERDCSIQIRNRKLMEESPASILDHNVRQKLYDASKKIVSKSNYVNAGTIEFLIDENKNVYFMEMNTRLQVEHPVTEMVTDVDLVKEQINIAEGKKIKFNKENSIRSGHSIECRINAEEYKNGLCPSTGVITNLNIPGGNGVRVDSALYIGLKITPIYDSNIAKLVVYGRDREECIRKLRRALNEFVIEGVQTNIKFLLAILNNQLFVSNKQNICTINELIRKRYFENLCLRDRDEAKEYIAATLQETKIKESSYTVCPSCKKELKDTDITNINVCNNCNYHFKMNCIDRLKLIFDKRSTELFDENIYSENPIEFPGYDDKLEHLINTLNIKEAVITGKGEIFGSEIYFGIMDYRFIMGSMGSVVGEKLTRMVERATEESKPIIIFTASGGARMQEGMISLYQMAKVVAAIEKHSQKGLLYISVLTDPTTGGVIASFASIADIIIGEPNATIGFAGKRIIKNTTNEEFPKNFQTSEFYFENGHIDMICERKKMKKTISDIISFYTINIDSKLKLAQYKNISTTFSHKNPKEISPWHRVKLARNSNRPNFQDYINYIFNDFIELHGDRICSDDPAIVTGVGYIKGIPVTVILSAKEKSLDKNITRNFGMAKPEGYRKVMRIIKQAEKFGRPVISFIDTPGAHCCVEAERRGQGEAIANCIRSFTKLTTPSIAIITGEGGSGGALATGVADWIFIMENGIYSVISPEGCASILFKNKAKAKEASEYLRLTSDELLKLNIVDEVISEPNGGENIDSEYLTNNIKTRLFNKLIELLNLDTNILLHNRYNKFRKCGVFKEI